MTRLFAVLALAAGLLLAACGSTGGSVESLAPISSDTSSSAPSLETSPEVSPESSMGPEASPS